MNSCGATFPVDVDTFHMLKFDSLTTRLAVSNFFNWPLSKSLRLFEDGSAWLLARRGV